MTDSFVFYRSFADGISYLSPEDQLEALWAIIRYALDEEEPECSGMPMAIFSMARPQIEENRRRYQNGQKGGRPRKDDEENRRLSKPETNGFEKNKNSKTNGFEKTENQKTNGYENQKPNVNVNDNDNLNANENVNANDNLNANENANAYQDISEPRSKEKDKDTGYITPPTPPSGEGEKKPKAKTKAEVMVDAVKKYLPDHNFSPGMVASVEDWVTYRTERRQPYTETGVRKLLSEIDKQAKAHGDAAVIDAIDQAMASGYQGIVWDGIGRGDAIRNRVSEVDSWI